MNKEELEKKKQELANLDMLLTVMEQPFAWANPLIQRIWVPKKIKELKNK